MRSEALVYAVAPLRTDVGTQECTQIGENGPSEPVWGTCVHCCDAIRRGVNPHEPPKSHLCARIYGKGVSVGGREADRPDWPFLPDDRNLGKAYAE